MKSSSSLLHWGRCEAGVSITLRRLSAAANSCSLVSFRRAGVSSSLLVPSSGGGMSSPDDVTSVSKRSLVSRASRATLSRVDRRWCVWADRDSRVWTCFFALPLAGLLRARLRRDLPAPAWVAAARVLSIARASDRLTALLAAGDSPITSPTLILSLFLSIGDRSLVAADRFLLFWRSFLVARRMLRLAVRSMCTNLSLVFTLKLTLFRRPTPRPRSGD